MVYSTAISRDATMKNVPRFLARKAVSFRLYVADLFVLLKSKLNFYSVSFVTSAKAKTSRFNRVAEDACVDEYNSANKSKQITTPVNSLPYRARLLCFVLHFDIHKKCKPFWEINLQKVFLAHFKQILFYCATYFLQKTVKEFFALQRGFNLTLLRAKNFLLLFLQEVSDAIEKNLHVVRTFINNIMRQERFL